MTKSQDLILIFLAQNLRCNSDAYYDIDSMKFARQVIIRQGKTKKIQVLKYKYINPKTRAKGQDKNSTTEV